MLTTATPTAMAAIPTTCGRRQPFVEEDDGHDRCDDTELGRKHRADGDPVPCAEREEREPDDFSDSRDE